DWDTQINAAKHTFNKCMETSHSFSKEDILAYKQIVDKFKSADPLRKYLSEAICADALIKNVDHQTHHLIEEMQEHMKNEFILQTQLDKLVQVGNVFPKFAPAYKEACQALAKHLTNYVNNAKECLDNYNFEEMRKNLELLAKVLSLQSHLASLFNIKQEITNLETQLLMCLRTLTNEGLGVIKRAIKDESNFHKEEKGNTFSFVQIEKLGKSDIEQLKMNANILERAVNVFELPCQHVNFDKPIKQVFQSFLDKVVMYFERISQKIGSLFEKQRHEAFDEIKDFVFIMDSLRKIKSVEQGTQQSYFQTIERIIGYVRDVHKDIELILPLLIKQDPSFDYNRLFECVSCMHRSKWIEERQEWRYDNLMDEVKNKLLFHLCELEKASRYLELDIDHPDNLEQGHKIVEHLEKLNSWNEN
ncbi:ATPase, partial [Reticulomyxa filosa]